MMKSLDYDAAWEEAFEEVAHGEQLGLAFLNEPSLCSSTGETSGKTSVVSYSVFLSSLRSRAVRTRLLLPNRDNSLNVLCFDIASEKTVAIAASSVCTTNIE